jgi:hypothetical protein
MLLTSVVGVLMFVYFVITQNYIPEPTDFLVLAVLNLVLAGPSKKNKD